MKEIEKEFYAHLGLLSVRFAMVEYNLSIILGKLFGTDDDLISVTLIEKNTLSQNVEMLKKINKIRSCHEYEINNIIELVGRIKSNRNLFIHGIWGCPFESGNDIKIICDERRIRHKYEKDINGKVIRENWEFNRNHILKLSDIKKQIDSIDCILLLQNVLIEKLKTEFF